MHGAEDDDEGKGKGKAADDDNKGKGKEGKGHKRGGPLVDKGGGKLVMTVLPRGKGLAEGSGKAKGKRRSMNQAEGSGKARASSAS